MSAGFEAVVFEKGFDDLREEAPMGEFFQRDPLDTDLLLVVL